MKRCRRLRELSAYGFDEMAKQTCFGVRFSLRAYRPGLVCFEAAPGNAHELRAAEDLLEGVTRSETATTGTRRSSSSSGPGA
jgi:hypothetical protein